MYAIIEDSGTQIKVEKGQVIDVDLRKVTEKQKTVTFERVLVAGKADGKKAAAIGTPYLQGATVTADILAEVKGRKIDVVKFKRRKGYLRKQGHRQRSLRVQIKEIKA